MSDDFNKFMESFPHEKIMLIEQLDDYSNLGQLIELLKFADENIQEINENPEAKCLNEMPNKHYFIGKFEPEKFYFEYNNQEFYINWHMYLSESMIENFSAKLANYFLEMINSPQRIFQLDEIYLTLNDNEMSEITTKYNISLSKPQLIGIEDYTPMNIDEMLYETQDILNKISTNGNASLPPNQSFSSTQAVQWAKEQKTIFLQLLSDDKFLENVNEKGKLRLIFNSLIVLARRLIADPRVIDNKYRKYPLLTPQHYEKLENQLKNSEIEVLEKFLFSDEIITACIHHQQKDKVLDKIFKK